MTKTPCVCPDDRAHPCFNATCATPKPFHHTKAVLTDEDRVRTEAKRLCDEYRRSLPGHVSTEAHWSDFTGQAVVSLGMTPWAHCDDHDVHEFWCPACDAAKAASTPTVNTPAPTPQDDPYAKARADTANDPWVRLANCTNYLEDEDRPCTGTLRFALGDPQAACDYCGAWCGWLVADYRPYVRNTYPTPATDTPDTGESA